jgi:acyl-[acyl-carrier-protein] desaturase
MLTYTVFQERATQLTYMNFGALARGEGSPEQYGDAIDPVLESACMTLAGDEAAHYSFFGNGLRLYLYYFPMETLDAIHDVLAHFAMPAQDVIPNWQAVAEAIYRTGVYGPKQFGRNVLVPVFKSLSLKGKKAIEAGLKRSRSVPDGDGAQLKTALWDAFEPVGIRIKAQRIHDKIVEYEAGYGRHALDPVKFVTDAFWNDPVNLSPAI